MAGNDILVERVSRFYLTACFPPGAGPDFVNAALRFSTPLDAPQVLERLHETEARFGRRRDARWSARTLDLDLLFLDDLVLPDRQTYDTWAGLSPDRQAQDAPDRLILPHPRLHERGFVLIPMRDVAPDWRHPVTGLTVRQMADALPEAEKAGVKSA